MSSEKTSVPGPFILYSTLVGLAALGALLASISVSPLVWSWQLALLVLAVVLSENFAMDLPHVGSASLAYPLTLAAAVLLGPTPAIVVAASSGANFSDLRDRRPLSILVMNVGQVSLSAALSAWCYVLLGGRVLLPVGGSGVSPHPVAGGDIPGMLLPLLAAACVGFLSNGLFLSVALSLFSGVSPVDVWRDGLLWTAPTQLALAIVGLMIAGVLAASPIGFVLFVLPLIVARNVYRNYAELKATYGSSVRALVGLLEAKDPYTRGHSERVAEYAGRLGKQLGLKPRQLQDLDNAALLHDIGKLRLPVTLLTKPGPLDADEYDAVKSHPAAGVRLISRIPHVEELVPLVRSHHEHFDGSGYPDGLAGEEIPFESRILSVADAFDAMTTARPYRPAMSLEAAREEIRRGSGSQFDPVAANEWCRLLEEEDPEELVLRGIASEMEGV